MVGRITVVSLLSPLPMAPDYPSRPFDLTLKVLLGQQQGRSSLDRIRGSCSSSRCFTSSSSAMTMKRSVCNGDDWPVPWHLLDPGVSAFSFGKPNLTLNASRWSRAPILLLAFDDDRCAMATAVTEPVVSRKVSLGVWIGTWFTIL